MLAGNLLSGGFAGATALLVSYPFDVARTKLVSLLLTYSHHNLIHFLTLSLSLSQTSY